MKLQIAIILLIALFTIEVNTRTACRMVTTRKCQNKRIGYYTRVRKRVKKTKRITKVVNKRQRYLHKTCYTKKVRQYFSKAQKYRKRVAYNAIVSRRTRVRYRKRYTKIHIYRKKYYKNVRKTHHKRVKFSKRLPKYRRVAFWRYYTATCSKKQRVKRRKKIVSKKSVPCNKRARVAKRVRYRKFVRVNSKRRIFTGRYASSGKPNCFKKVYKMVPYVKIVKRWAYKVVLVWGIKRSRCIRTYNRYVYYYTTHVRKYRCRRKKKQYKTVTSYYTKWFTKTIKYTRIHKVAYYKSHKVRKAYYRWAYKYVSRRTTVRRYKFVNAYKNVKSSRVVPVSGTRSVWKYRTVPVVIYVNKGYYAYTYHRVKRYKNTRVCVNVRTRKCSN